MASTPKSFTGQRRQRTTRWQVRCADRVSRALITVGGIGTIIAVMSVCVFLVAVVLPLFTKADVGQSQSGAVDAVNHSVDELNKAVSAIDDGNVDSAQTHYDRAATDFQTAASILQ